MQNAITTLRIQNFKSIKDVTMQPRRVNIIIGEPNVGKSNILEALSLLGAGLYESNRRFLDAILRYETLSNLFYDNDNNSAVLLETNIGNVILAVDERNDSLYKFVQVSDELWKQYKEVVKRQGEGEIYLSHKKTMEEALKQLAAMDIEDVRVKEALSNRKVKDSNFAFTQARVHESGQVDVLKKSYYSPSFLPKKYAYSPNQPHNIGNGYNFLQPPQGINLLNVIRSRPEFLKEMAALFRPYGLKLVLRLGENKFEIQKQVGDLVWSYPYSLIADTLQRIIFYLAAIESNLDSVLLFEEPEAHSFPEYIIHLAQSIVASRNNQFFVVTHNPYLLTEILEEMLTDDEVKPELAIFAAYYEEYQTKVHQLTDEEMVRARADGLDFFLNLRRFVPEAE